MDRKIRRLKRLVLLLFLAVVLVLVSFVLWFRLEDTASFSPIFVDRNGKLLFTELSEGGLRYPFNLSQLPPLLPQLLIVAEDENFYQHPGFDLKGIVRAVYLNLKAGQVVAGGSTLTQQLSHQLFFPDQTGRKNVGQKVVESLFAVGLDLVWSKEKILEEYLNSVYFGRLAYGIEAASQQYFGKSAAALDLAETSTLLALLHLPSASDPRENLGLLKQRQKYVLERGVKLKIITDQEADLADLEPLSFTELPDDLLVLGDFCLQEYLKTELARLWQLYELGVGSLNRSGLVIQTTLDENLLQESRRLVQAHLTTIAKETQAGSAAVVAIEPGSGEVLSYVCNVSATKKDSAVDLVQALRQPGSAIKPVTYLAALNQGFTLADKLNDSQQVFYTRKNEAFVPEDYDQRERGEIILREALASSLNIPAVQLLSKIGLKDFFDTARALGIKSFEDENRYDLAITLGGGEISLLELTTAYATLANQLNWVESFVIKEIRAGEKVIYSHPVKLQENVLGKKSQGLSYLLSDVLSDNFARRLSFSEINPLLTSNKTAAKTGTTQDFRDSWTLGYNSKIVLGVWVGNADHAPMQGVSGATGAAPIWHDLMEMFFKEGYVGWFEQSAGVVALDQELFLSGTEPVRIKNQDLSSNFQITYPYQNQVFKINPLDDLALYQGLVFKAQVPEEVGSVEWWLSGELLGETRTEKGESQFKWQPQKGTFQLKITSSQGAAKELKFKVMQE